MSKTYLASRFPPAPIKLHCTIDYSDLNGDGSRSREIFANKQTDRRIILQLNRHLHCIWLQVKEVHISKINNSCKD